MNQNQILERGKSKKEILWAGNIRKSTATALGRTGINNKAGIDNKIYALMLNGTIAIGDFNDNS
jgi:hypothetical protein